MKTYENLLTPMFGSRIMMIMKDHERVWKSSFFGERAARPMRIQSVSVWNWFTAKGNLQQILNMLLVQQLPPTLPESMEPAVKVIVANALQHEAWTGAWIGCRTAILSRCLKYMNIHI